MALAVCSHKIYSCPRAVSSTPVKCLSTFLFFSFVLLHEWMQSKQVAWKADVCFFLLKFPEFTHFKAQCSCFVHRPSQTLGCKIFGHVSSWWPVLTCLYFNSVGEICGFKIHGQNVPFEAVVVDKSTGEGIIRSKEKLDCELQKDYTFTIQAYDCGKGPDGANAKKSHK